MKIGGGSDMTVHFFYNFREELVNKIKEEYEDELEKRKKYLREQTQLDEAEKIILDYFKPLKNGLNEVFEVSDGEICYDEGDDFIAKFRIKDNSIKFSRKEKSIEVKAKYYIEDPDIVESRILGHIVVGDKRCMVKEVGKIHTGSHFDENTINYYLRNVFEDYLQ